MHAKCGRGLRASCDTEGQCSCEKINDNNADDVTETAFVGCVVPLVSSVFMIEHQVETLVELENETLLSLPDPTNKTIFYHPPTFVAPAPRPIWYRRMDVIVHMLVVFIMILVLITACVYSAKQRKKLRVGAATFMQFNINSQMSLNPVMPGQGGSYHVMDYNEHEEDYAAVPTDKELYGSVTRIQN